MTQRFLVVSLHDVHPGSWEAYRELADELSRRGLDRLVWLVVPAWKGASAPLPEPYAAWLRGRAAGGDEIVLHGLTHRAERVGGGPMARLVGRVYTAGEGEFHQLVREEARERLERGRRLLAAAGLAPRGFVAPAWLLSSGARRAVADAGFAYTTTFGGIDRFDPPGRVAAPVVTWSSRSAWRRLASPVWGAAWSRLRGRTRVLRLAVHPGDLDHPHLRRAFVDLVARALDAGRCAVTYLELLERLAEVSGTSGETVG